MNTKKLFDKNIIATLLLICFICAVFIFASVRVTHLTTVACFDTLDEATAQVAVSIRTRVETDREQLDVIADLLSQHEEQDSETIKFHLSSYHQRGTLSAVGLLLPDSRLILGAGEENIFENVLDYNTELAKVPYISGVVTVPDGSEEKVIYQAVPMKKDGQTIGILYGFVNLAEFADSFTVTAFDGKAQVYVADGNTGDFLVDTWHKKLGNIFDGDILNRKVKPGYDFYEMKMDFVAGRSGHIAFWSNSAGEYFYSYYMPVGVDRWMVQLTVPESIVFARAIQIRNMLYLVAGLEILAFAAYFLWVLSRVRKDTAQKNQRLAQSLYMYDVQQALFDAHKAPSLFTIALRKVSDMLTADTSFFLSLEGSDIKDAFFSSDAEQPSFFDQNTLNRHFLPVFQRLTSGQSLLLYPEEIEMFLDEQDRAELIRLQITNLMLVPVLNSSQELVGILGCINMKQHWPDSTLLECVSSNFLMALSNMVFYRQIERMSIIDALTGLRNRNCYESSLAGYTEKTVESLGCLYIDANGLHELNNTLGHAAGDAMLVSIGDCLRSLFPPQDCYRIGGDEFAVFCTNCSKEELTQRIDRLNEDIVSLGYHISIGEAWLSEALDVKDMVATAEKNMYEAKRLYYQQAGDLSKARLMNQKLEHILLEKKDSDAFLDIISSRFMGTYIVDMKADWVRAIYKPSYFSEILEENHYRFMPSIQAYGHAYVADDDQEGFLDVLNYDRIRRQLQSQHEIKYNYRKKDGKKLVLRIYPSRDYGPDNAEAILLFEEASD